MGKNLCCCKLGEVKEMLNHGAPLSIIAQTLNVRISDILHLDDGRALGK
jgi:hypothetical protein